MLTSEILNPELSFHHLECASKKRLLENLSNSISEVVPSFDADELFDNLIAREKLGSTGLGEGVAIPHCRLENCFDASGTIVKLSSPIDFDAIDGEPVDLLFILIVPKEATQDHLDILSKVAELFNSSDVRNHLRNTKNSEELYETTLSYMQDLDSNP